ncbi:hypothetical protein [Haloechinothrix halophila]|uniref:hypothetical protein n=1 Tax=Haloechinothrix halophila TaxID=1069073 RepID=UPI0004024B57|nr:hypothetical protein [Haloechinothrix halophila]
MAAPRKVIVSVDTEEPETLADIAAQLSQHGLAVESVLDTLATITGTCDESDLGSLTAVPGVLDVEAQYTYQLPPPTDRVQ